jgi:hypothetical protein
MPSVEPELEFLWLEEDRVGIMFVGWCRRDTDASAQIPNFGSEGIAASAGPHWFRTLGSGFGLSVSWVNHLSLLLSTEPINLG